MELQKNQIVKLRNGSFGAVASFNDKAFQIIFTAFTSPIRKYDADLKAKNSNYDIVEVYDGTSLAEVTDVFKRSFNAEGLKLIWKEA